MPHPDWRFTQKKKKYIYIYIYFETEVNVIGFKSCGIYIAFIFYHILNKKKKKKELSYRVPYIINWQTNTFEFVHEN